MYRWVVNWIVRTAAVISCSAVLLLTLVVVYEVAMRHIFGRPTIWANEISSYTLIWLGLLAIVVALSHDRHLRVDLVFVHFPRRIQVSLNILTAILMLCVAVFIAWKGYIYWWEAHSKNWTHYGMLYLPMTYTRIAVPLIGIILCAQIILHIYDYFRSLAQVDSAEKQL